VDGSLTCSRLGCDAPAVAVFAFDARECLVWLDPIGNSGRGAGVLCQVHADRMSPPRGWNLLDRRGRESRLWLGRTPLVSTPPKRRERTVRARSHAALGPCLPFDAPAAHEPEPQPAPTPAPSPVPAAAPVAAPPAPVAARAPWSPHEKPGPEFEHVLDARTPLLARAFEAARPTDDER
jgi:hypothetical protein